MSKGEMEYDVALSFAGEDRAYVDEVAASLRAMGIRVFYDKYETVSLWGKDLYTHLREIYSKRAKYTVMCLSKHYKEKLWTNHERESAQARAFLEKREYILPARFDNTEIPGLLPTTGYIDLNQYSPGEFAELIKQKVGEIVPGKELAKEVVQRKAHTTSNVLIMLTEGNLLLLETSRIESAKTLNMSLLPSNTKESALIASMRQRGQDRVIVAYGTTALLARVGSVSQIVESGREVWNVEFTPSENDYGSGGVLGDMAYNNYSADDLAEMRARRILLDEKLYGAAISDQNRLSLQDAMPESFIRDNGTIKVERSPFPSLYSAAKENVEEFLELARLYAVIYLILSGAIEHIHFLELRMNGETELGIRFEGQRARHYVNVAPHIIKIEGSCRLTNTDNGVR